jgi:dolichol-phosphate mannosyltransferase
MSNFILNDLWTFRDRRAGGLASLLSRAPKFALVSAVAIGLYYAIYIPLTRYLEIYELLALAAAIGVGLVWNFTANALWTWKKRSPADSLE